MKRTLSQELLERGLIYQHSTETLEEILDGEKRKGYLGVDPSADSIHVGNLVAYIFAQHLKNNDREMVLLVGGATGLIGDPSFQTEEREMVDTETIKARAEAIKKQIQNIDGLDKMKVVNNFDWFKEIHVLEFLREVGKHFNIGTMTKRESVKQRIEGENGISFTEFSYPLIQGYDFFYLYENEGCNLQIGGSDQWGNIISGVDFIRRKIGKTTYAITLPLIVDKSTGKKFGKSEGNAIWLDPNRTSPFEFYQFWINSEDEAAIDYLKKFTFLSLEEITEIEKKHFENPALRTAQKTLAYEVTKFVHGQEVADAAAQVSETLFYGGNLSELNTKAREIILQEAPSFKVEGSIDIVELLITTQLANSKREAREFIANGAISLDDVKITDEKQLINISDLTLLRRGKKKLCVLY